MYIDTHCHLEKKYYDDINKIIEDNKKAGIEKIIVSCCEKDEIEEYLELVEKYDCLYLTIGYHPDQVEKIKETDLEILTKILIDNKKVVGVGEIGLDYHYQKENKNFQIKLFEQQLEIAEKLNLPVVIHSRDATEDTINILKKYNVKGVIHCFSGSLETANLYIKMGFKLGIGGVVTFKNSKLKEVLKNIDISNIVLETDSPYLTPHPYRGEINSSKYIPIIAKEISNIYETNIEDFSKQIFLNTVNIFTHLK